MPADPAGLLSIDKIDVARDGKQIVYGYERITSDLYASTTSDPLSDALAPPLCCKLTLPFSLTSR